MILFLVLIVVLLIGLTTAAVLGKLGGFMADPTSSRSFGGLPPGPLAVDDLAHLRFDQALRGYRMDEVDGVIDALSARIRELEEQAVSRSDEAVSSPAGRDLPDAHGDSAVAGGDSRDAQGESTAAGGGSPDAGSKPQE